MSAIIVKKFDYVFESVQFAIDIRAGRKALGLTQGQVGELLGHKTAAVVSVLENARYDETVKMSDFLFLCNLYDLQAPRYFEIEPT